MESVVETSFGRLSGTRAGRVLCFRGIPYAAPPIGPLRFRAPLPPAHWSGVRTAHAFGPAAPQLAHPLSQVGHSSEDCLYLNVWSCGTSGKKPVLVFVHGGAYIFGAGHEPTYDGARLAERGDVVVVTLNYRLSALGFLALPDVLPHRELASNAGLLDVQAALTWVQNEIGAFGGDPGNVTLFGESAGACSVAALLGMSSARGLFSRAISQSGGLRVTTPYSAARTASELLELLDISPNAPERLWQLPATEVLQASSRLETAGVWGIHTRAVSPFRPSFRFGPIGDRDGMPGDLAECVRAGTHRVPLIVGTNRHEWSFFSQLSPDFAWGGAEQTQQQLVDAFGEHASSLIAAYRDAPLLLGDALADVADAIMGDAVFRMPSLCLADAQAEHSPTYMYLLDHRSPRRKGKLGACHVVDLPLVFRTLDSPTGQYFVGGDAHTSSVSDLMSDAWIAFAHSGAPLHAGLSEWPRYDSKHRATLQLGAIPHVLHDPLSEQRRAWQPTGLFETAAC